MSDAMHCFTYPVSWNHNRTVAVIAQDVEKPAGNAGSAEIEHPTTARVTFVATAGLKQIFGSSNGKRPGSFVTPGMAQV